MGEVVQFGKYQGEPVETLARDREYVEWLLAQPWFREQHGAMYRRLRRGLGMPEETPVHNRLQGMFLDPTFCRAFVGWTLKGMFEPPPQQTVVFEEKGFDVLVRYADNVRRPWGRSRENISYYVECKPVVGDDYPVILRQMKRAGPQRLENQSIGGGIDYKVLLVGAYNGVGITKKDFVTIFKMDRIRVVFLDDVIGVMVGEKNVHDQLWDEMTSSSEWYPDDEE